MEPLKNTKRLDKIVSDDHATKHVVEYHDGLVGEVTYINYPNKDIVCVPTQTACRMGCKFCFLTTNGSDAVYRNLAPWEMEQLVDIAIEGVEPRKPLLVSFMGAGEPLVNSDRMLTAMESMVWKWGKDVRFAFATMIPMGFDIRFLTMTQKIVDQKLPVKIHLSLHFTDEEQRAKYLPRATNIKTSLSLLEMYHEVTGNPVEVHYTLIKGVNDAPHDATALAALVKPRNIPVKVLHYSENPSLVDVRSPEASIFVEELRMWGAEAEYYKPNGLGIGASCGQFQLERYVRKV